MQLRYKCRYKPRPDFGPDTTCDPQPWVVEETMSQKIVSRHSSFDEANAAMRKPA